MRYVAGVGAIDILNRGLCCIQHPLRAEQGVKSVLEFGNWQYPILPMNACLRLRRNVLCRKLDGTLDNSRDFVVSLRVFGNLELEE